MSQIKIKNPAFAKAMAGKQKSNIKNGKNGFSLIEMIVVISILGVVMVIASSFLMVSLMASSKADITKEVRQNGNQALSVIEGMVLNSLDVSCTAGGILVRDIDDNLSTIVFEDGKISSTSASTGKVYFLTSTNVSVTNGSFTCDKNPGQPTTVVVNFLVGIGSPLSRPSEKASLNFKTQIVTRNISNF